MAGDAIYRVAQIDAPFVASLPEPPETFRICDLDHVDDPHEMIRFMRAGVLVQESRTRSSIDGHVWSVNPEAYQQALDHLERTPRFDCCGSTGITNDNGTIRCIDCGEPKTRAECEEVL